MHNVIWPARSAVLVLALLFGCQAKKPAQSAFEVFNAGAAYSIKAAGIGDTGLARPLERQALVKYREALQLDSTHRLVRSAMGHSYYMLDEYGPAIQWFEASNRLDSTAAPSYRELALCRISLGQAASGWRDLQHAFRLDSSTEIKTVTADDLYYLGQSVYANARYYAATDTTRSREYRQYAVQVLQMASSIDPQRQDIRQTLAAYAVQPATDLSDIRERVSRQYA